MSKLRFVLGFVLGLMTGMIATAYAINFTIVLSQPQIDIATWEWNQEDPGHATWGTAQLFGAAKVIGLIDEWKQRRIVFRRSVVGSPTGYFCTNTWPGLGATAQNNLCLLAVASGGLGEVTACTPCSATGD